MNIEAWGIRGDFYLHISQLGAPAWLLIAGYAALLLVILWRTRREWAAIRGARLALLAAFAPAAFILFQAFLIHLDSPYLLLPPGLPEAPRGAVIALFGGALVLLSGAWLGIGPAVVVGFAGGLARAGWGSYSPFVPFETALTAALAAYLMRQRYQGRTMAALRRPVIAGPLSALCVWGLHVLGLALQSPNPSLASVDYALVNMGPALLAGLVEMFIGGLFVQLAQRWRPVAGAPGLTPAPWQTGLGPRMLFSFLPVTLVSFLVVIGAVSVIGVNTATGLVVTQMARDADHVVDALPFFMHTGANLLHDLAGRLARLDGADAGAIQAALRDGTRVVSFFWQLYYVQADSTAYQYPDPPGDLPPITAAERDLIDLALTTGMPQDAFLLPGEEAGALGAGFIVPVRGAAGEVTGALLGRTSLDVNPVMEPVVAGLRSVAGGRGAGFIVDKDRKIILHPTQPDLVTQPFTLGVSATALDEDYSGAAYRRQTFDGALELVYVQPIPGADGWSVVILAPNRVALEQAVQVAAPLAALMAAVSAVALALIYVLAGRITRPITRLARAADHVAGGDLTCPIPVTGVDEVGRLGGSLAHMRDNLTRRLDEQALLLQVSQAASADLEIDHTLPPILAGCLRVTGAAGARVVLDGHSASPSVYRVGTTGGDDRALLDGVRAGGRLVIPDLAHAPAGFDAAVSGPAGALAALPLRYEGNDLGALCVNYREARTFSESELTFLETLAGQVTVTVVKAQLYEAARSGREQLEVILTSTADAVLVADHRDTLVMVNPAAGPLLGVEEVGALIGQPVAEVVKPAALVELLRSVPEGEVVGADGRAYAARASQLKTAGGRVTGRVVVLHDITHLKEIDARKDDFMQIVSHDLRSPLTYMRGYATMLGMVGELNDKQQGFADKIIIGIEQMSSLIENVLDIGRLESGGELERVPCDLTNMVEDIVTGQRAQAMTKKIALTANVDPNLPIVMADEHMLRQAITNLVDNAIKYTPLEGQVAVEAQLDEAQPDGKPRIVVAVADNGPGIGEADQARLFEKFYRVRRKDNIKVKGSGLGLTIVKAVAQRHGGDAWVKSAPGEGSTFYLSVEVAAPGSVAAALRSARGDS
ncbi:MAG: HAMP domain-containing protein [Anaerolineae bacterium]|nr:HAMP domain-containing protein [Anaerolineae bacterium]